MAFKDAFVHHCELPPAVDFAYTVIPGDTRIAKLRRSFLRGMTINPDDKRAQRIFKSSTAINFERARHIKDNIKIIHPFSSIRNFWDRCMIFVYIYALFLTPIYVGFVTTQIEPSYPISWIICDLIQCTICMVDIIMNICTGYLEENKVVLIRWKIFVHYLSRYFIFDLLSSIPFDYFVCLAEGYWSFCGLWSCLRMLKIARIIALHQSIRYVAENIHISPEIAEIGWILLVAFIIINVCASVQYLYSFLIVEEEDLTWILRELLLSSSGIFHRYRSTFYRTSANYLNCSFGLSVPHSFQDQLLTMIIAVIGTISTVIAIGRVLQWGYVRYSSSTVYNAIMQQLTTYMHYKQLPMHLRKRLIQYYEFRYQGKFYNEADIMNMLSSQLRQEIVIQDCLRLVESVSFFHNLPYALLARISVCLHPEFFLANDVIIKAGALGDCMYFISVGTVAVYTPTGMEVCHLEDGAHFGEIALVMKSKRRVASVVAVEICELYRLRLEDFTRALSPYPDLMARIERIAEERSERTARLDERNTRALRRKADRTTRTRNIKGSGGF